MFCGPNWSFNVFVVNRACCAPKKAPIASSSCEKGRELVAAANQTAICRTDVHCATLKIVDQAMAIEHRVDGAPGRHPDISVEATHQQFADLAGAPVRLLVLQPDDQGLDRLRELVGVAYRPAWSGRSTPQAVLLVAIENLVASLAGYAELPADLGHGFPIQKPGDKTKALFHYRTRFPRHQHLPQNKSGKCNPCVRYVLSPMSRAAHSIA